MRQARPARHLIDVTLPANLTLIEQPDPAIIAQIVCLRAVAWRSRFPSFPAMEQWTDALDERALHWAVIDGDDVVAAARMTVHPDWAALPDCVLAEGYTAPEYAGPLASLNRLFVLKSHARMGLSELLDEVRIARARALGCRHVIGRTNSSAPRQRVLEGKGFVTLGPAADYASGPLSDYIATQEGQELLVALPL